MRIQRVTVSLNTALKGLRGTILEALGEVLKHGLQLGLILEHLLVTSLSFLVGLITLDELVEAYDDIDLTHLLLSILVIDQVFESLLRHLFLVVVLELPQLKLEEFVLA